MNAFSSGVLVVDLLFCSIVSLILFLNFFLSFAVDAALFSRLRISSCVLPCFLSFYISRGIYLLYFFSFLIFHMRNTSSILFFHFSFLIVLLVVF
jgi:hypothetical protein